MPPGAFFMLGVITWFARNRLEKSTATEAK